MLREITARQFQEHRAYADLEPWDEERADARTALVVQAVLNTSPHRRKGSRAVELNDCLLHFGTSKAVASQPARTADEARLRAAATRRIMDGMISDQKKAKRARG